MGALRRYDVNPYALDPMVLDEDPEGDWVRYEELPQWQPIETAPKDGTPILLGGGGVVDYRGYEEPIPRPAVAHYEVDQYSGGEWVVGYYDGNFGRVVYVNPTHWMPPPSSPPKP